jgi:hypothetical protein
MMGVPFNPIHAAPGPVDGGLFNRVQDLIRRAFRQSESEGNAELSATSINGQTGDITLDADEGITVTGSGLTLTVGQVLTAQWSMPAGTATPNVRWYALSASTGNDAATGYSDASAAAAGLVAVRTAAQLDKILPIDGRGRNVVVLIEAGDYAAVTSFLMGRVGYASFVCRATCTNATAGSVAFLDDTADRDMNGNVTATGMFAAGYNPTGAPAVDTFQVLRVGGAAPAFPAEPAIPAGARLRFGIAAPTQAALRGLRRSVVGVSGTDRLLLDKDLPVAPVATDVLYLEMPGAGFTALRAIVPGGTTAGTGMQISGLIANGTVAGNRGININGNAQLANCWATNAQASPVRGLSVSLNSVYTNANATTQNTGGACRTVGSWSMAGFSTFVLPVGTGPFSQAALGFDRGGTVEIQTAFVTAGGLSCKRVHITATPPADLDPDCIGTNALQASQGYGPCRIIGPGEHAGLELSCGATITSLDITGCGALPAILLRAAGETVYIQPGLTGATGNTDVGLDLTDSCVSNIVIDGTLPTLTGTVGDVRLADGTIVTWAHAAAGIVDVAGNVLTGVATSPLKHTPVAAGAVAVAWNNAPAGSPAAPARYAQIPDGAGGFFTFPSLT